MDEAQKKLISEISHEVKGPLTTINLYSEALISGSVGPLTDEQKDYLNEIHTASKKLITRVNALADKAKQS